MANSKSWPHSTYPNGCVECGGKERSHVGKGLCRLCYMRKYVADNPEKVRGHKRKWYEQNIVGTDKQKQAREARNFDGQRERILERDGHKCVRCESTKQLIVHHKDRSGRGAEIHNNADGNLETICRKCHVNEHRQELEAAKTRPTHCKHGHPMTAEYGSHNGKQWVCRVCAKLRARKYREDKRLGG